MSIEKSGFIGYMPIKKDSEDIDIDYIHSCFVGAVDLLPEILGLKPINIRRSKSLDVQRDNSERELVILTNILLFAVRKEYKDDFFVVYRYKMLNFDFDILAAAYKSLNVLEKE